MNSNWRYSPETPNLGQIWRFLEPCDLEKFHRWPWKTIWRLFYATSTFVHHFVAIGELKMELQSGNAHLGQIRRFLEPYDHEIWRMTLKNNREPFLCYFKLGASFCSHWWIKSGVRVRKRPIWVKSGSPLLCCFQLCAWFHCHMWIQTGVRVRKRLSWVLTDLDLWPLTLTFCMDITSVHGNNSWKFHDDTMMGTWWERCDGRTDRRTDGRTEPVI